MLALSQHNTLQLAYYAFYYAGIFDAGLPMHTIQMPCYFYTKSCLLYSVHTRIRSYLATIVVFN